MSADIVLLPRALLRRGALEIDAELHTRGLQLTIDPRSIYARIEPIRDLSAEQITRIIDSAMSQLGYASTSR